MRNPYARSVVFGVLASLFSITGEAAASLSMVGQPATVASLSNNSGNPFNQTDLAYGDGYYAVVYSESTGNVKVVFIEPESGLAVATYALSTVQTSQGFARIAYDDVNRRFGVIWWRNDSQIYFQAVTINGPQLQQPVVVTPSSSWPGDEQQPDLAWDGSRYVLVFSYYGGGMTYDLQVVTFSAAGARMASAVIDTMTVNPDDMNRVKPLFGGPDAFAPCIAAGGNEYALTYQKNNHVYYANLNNSLGLKYGPTDMTVGGVSSVTPRVAYKGGGDFGIVWTWVNGNLTSGGLYFARASSSGIALTVLFQSGFLWTADADIAWDGNRFIVGYKGVSATSSGLYALTSNASGTPEGTAINLGGEYDGTRIAVKTADQYLTTWRPNTDHINAVRLSNSIVLSTTASPTASGTFLVDIPGPYIGTETVHVTALPANGYVFNKWGGDASGTDNPFTVVMNSSKSLIGYFCAGTCPGLTVNVSPNGGGTVTNNGVLMTPGVAVPTPSGSSVSLAATANSGYIFSSWSGYPAGSNISGRVCQFSMPATDTTVTANFSTAYSVSSTANPTNGGSVSPSGSGQWYGAGTQVSFSATPAANYSFTSWNVNGADVGSANPLLLTIDSNKTIYANFTYGGGGTTYTLTTAVSPSGTGTVSPAGTTVYASGAQVSVRATPNAGYVLDQWTGSVTGTSNPVLVTMNGNKTVTANFKVGTSGNAPLISNLIQTTSITSKRATFTVDYQDTDGDIDNGKVNVTYWYKDGGRHYSKSYTIPSGVKSVTGTTTGTIEFTVKFRSWKNSYKRFDLTASVQDSGGLSSNTLSQSVKKNKRKKSSSEHSPGEEPDPSAM